MKTKLILIEGIPGSGKSTTAKYIQQLLNNKAIDHYLFQEGDLEHPADYESVACLTERNYQFLLDKFPEYRSYIMSITYQGGQHYFINYVKTMLDNKETFPTELFKELEEFDVYKQPLDTFRLVILERWKNFVEKAKTDQHIYIFECAFLQNIVNVFLARDDRPTSEIKEFISELSDVIKELNPIIFYYDQENVKETIDRVRKERSPEWFDFSIFYYTQQLFGINRRIEGFEGVITYLEARKQVEFDILSTITIEKVILNNSSYDWDESYKKIQAQIELKI